MPDRLLTVDELAEWLRMPRATLYNWVSEGKLPYVKVGPRLRFKAQQIEAWILEREHAAAER